MPHPWLTWQPEHAVDVAPSGLIQPCGFTTLFSPTGRIASEPFTWHIAQFRVSPGFPCGLIGAYRIVESHCDFR